MGFPVGYSEVFLPMLFIQTLSLLGLLRSIIFSLLRCLGLYHLIDPEIPVSENEPTRIPDKVPASAILIREFLPAVKFDGDALESCAVCLCEVEAGEEIRWLANCRHVYHRGCVDSWMDQGQSTCPLCRTLMVPREVEGEFDRRLCAASGLDGFHAWEASLSRF
ncbi:hypothetical protein NMG60_11022820 [Bertholletia excelsa]